MSWLRLATASQNAACDAVVDLIDAGTGAGTIEIYDDTAAPPASANDAVPATSVKLGTLTFYDPAFGAAVDGVATAGLITSDTSADADGTASWARIKDSGGNVIFDCDVGTTGTVIVLNTVNIVIGATISITAGSVTMPSGA